MAFRRLQNTLSLLTLILFLNTLTDNVVTAISVREKCECVKETGFVKWRRFTDFQIKMPEPLCNKVQIVIHMGNTSSCLRPESKQGKKLRKCWIRIKFNEQEKKTCLQHKPKKTRRPKKQ